MDILINEETRIRVTLGAVYDQGFKDGMAEAHRIIQQQGHIQTLAKELKEELDRIRENPNE
jgi:hypothetical protein